MEKSKNSARTVQEELSRERKYWRQNLIWTALLALLVFFGMLGTASPSVAPGAAGLTLTMHDGSTDTVDYSAIVSAVLSENTDYGTVIEGKDTRTGKSGSWEHPEWGNYTCCTYASCPLTVRISVETHTYVINLPSEAETRQLYQMIQDKLPASK